MPFTAIELLETKRDGGVLSDDAIAWLIRSYTEGVVPDYQMSAMAMAIVLNGLSDGELVAWTEAMLRSGDVLDFPHITAKVDKHSTGGVGDKISIPLAPLVASCGVAMPMISGRGLGHTGGTLDKLESIPGFTTNLDKTRFRKILEEHGLVLAGQSETIAPADRKLYALRDATGTVPSIPLIASSIMSKKLAEGIDGLVLDVKMGTGGFMKTIEEARELAKTMVGIGSSHGVRTIGMITSMSQPLGTEVGNANEIAESVAVLRGQERGDVLELTLVLGEVMLDLAGITGGRELLEAKISSGEALEKFIEVTIAHGGDPAYIEDTSLLPRAANEAEITAPQSGYVTRCDALAVGVAATRLGAGRERKEDAVDPGVSISIKAKTGARVDAGDALAVIRYSDSARWESQRDGLAAAWSIGDEPPEVADLVLERVEI